MIDTIRNYVSGLFSKSSFRPNPPAGLSRTSPAAMPLTSDFATRQRTQEWGMYLFGILPDYDTVFERLGLNAADEMRKIFRTDSHVFSCFLQRIGGTLAREWQIDKNPDDPDQMRAETIAMECRNMFSKLDVPAYLTDVLRSILYGVQPIEVTWSPGNRWTITMLEGKPYEYFRYHPVGNEPRFMDKMNLIEGMPIPPYKMLFAKHFATYENPYGIKLLSMCYMLYLLKHGGLKFWSALAEKFGAPWVVATIPDLGGEKGESDKKAFLDSLVNAYQSAVFVTYAGQEIKLVEAASASGAAPLYSELMSLLTQEISKAFLGQSATSDMGEQGSYAAVKSYMSVVDNLAQMDWRTCSKVTETLLGWYVELNYGSDIPAPVFSFYEETDIQKDRADRDAVLVGIGVEFEEEYIVREYKFQKGDVRMTAPAMQPQTPTGIPKPNPAVFSEGCYEFAESWIGVDLDGVLAVISGAYDPKVIGEPVKPMLDKVKRWIKDGKKVKILTARATDKKAIPAIRKWLTANGLPNLEITNKKDHDMTALYDDKAIQVKKNKGDYVRHFGGK